jgi:beta-glucanase (GH16 family)
VNRLCARLLSFVRPALPALLLSAGFSSSIPAAEWVLIWSDEFDGPAGQVPQSARWDYNIGTDWGNAQLEYDTDRASNVSLDGNGNLAITARQEFYLGQPYTSARIVTCGRFETTYGRIEARIKLPTGQGLWPAFWLLGSNFESIGWPQCGEIDIMEYRGQEPTVAWGTVHGPGYSGSSGFGNVYVLPSGRFDSSFHTFAVEWEVERISWYVDNVLYHQVTPADVAPSVWVFDHPSYIVLNVAVGGNFVGLPDPSTVFPQTMAVDYVRVYRDTVSGEACCALRGDVNSSGSVTSADVIALVNFVFKGGAAVACPAHGDVNINGTITSADIIYLVNFVFKGGPEPVGCVAPSGSAPAWGAPAPTWPEADVISIFSGMYADVTVDTWSAVWDDADVADYPVGADLTKKYTDLTFAAIEFATYPLDVDEMSHVHLDVWTPDPTDAPAVFKVKLVDFGVDGIFGGGDDVEHELTFDENIMNTGSWVQIDVPLADFTGLTTRAHLAQLLISGDPNTVFLDNICFHR